MPWCDDCSKFWERPQLAPAGTCPNCGRPLASSAVVAVAPAPVEKADPDEPGTAFVGPGGAGMAELSVAPGPRAASPTKRDGAPWHFKLLVVGVTVYMIYRIYWLVEWLPKHI